jgi:hypothetical protein
MNAPIVSFKALCAARSTLEDFCLSYFMFHGLDGSNAITCEHLPLLNFVESAIYAADEENEQLLASEKLGSADAYAPSVIHTAIDTLCSVLAARQLLDSRVKEQLQLGAEYWELERKICTALVTDGSLELEDVIRAIELKSFDYRTLNLLLSQLSGKPYDDDAIDFLWYSEVLIEIGDDLVDYEEDILKNSFNILRCFVRLFGAFAPIKLTAFISELEALYEQKLLQLDSHLQVSYRKRCTEAMGMHSTSGKWMVPPIIHDEAGFIAQVQCTSEGRAHEANEAIPAASSVGTTSTSTDVKSSMRRLEALRDRQAMRRRVFCACAAAQTKQPTASTAQGGQGDLLARVLENERKQKRCAKRGESSVQKDFLLLQKIQGALLQKSQGEGDVCAEAEYAALEEDRGVQKQGGVQKIRLRKKRKGFKS